MVTNRQSWQLFWRQKNILSSVIAAYYGHCTKLGDIASMLQKKDYHWSPGSHSIRLLAQAVPQATLFGWLFIYLSCFRTIGLIFLTLELHFNVQCQFLSQWSFATMAGSETLDMSHMRRAGAWCRWGPWSLSSVPLIIRYYHNNHPGTGGRLAWDGTCWDQWNIIGQVEQLFIHSLAHPATSFKGRFSASSASHYELNKLSLVLSYFYCLWWSVVVGVFKYRSWHQTFPADMKKVMVWWSTLSCYVFSLITDHLPCGSRSAPPRHAARAREREGDIITGHLHAAASWSAPVHSYICK